MIDEKKDNVQLEGQTNVEDLLMDAADNAAMQSDEEKEEQKIKLGVRWHESHTDRRSIRSILKMYKNGNIKLPLCQRVYVWKDKDRKDLLLTIKKGYGCGTLSLGTHEGDSDNISYLIDGQQRLVSMMILSNDKTLSSEEQKTVLDYQMSMLTVYQLSWNEMAEYFVFSNSGIAVGQATKKTAALPAQLRNLGIEFAGNEFFREIAKKANSTFSKNEQYKTITWNILLACAGVPIGSNRSKDLYPRIKEYEADIIKNKEEANKVINKLKAIYNDLDDTLIRRSMNANFVSVLVYIMVDYKDITVNQYKDLIKYIFANRQAIKEYSATTHGASACEVNVKKRYEVLINLLNNPVKTSNIDSTQNIKEENKSDSTFTEINKDIDDKAFKEFCKKHSKNVLNTKSKDCPVDFNDMTKDEKQMYYKFSEIEKNVNKVEGVIMKAFNRIEKISA
jgi:hypothetical protein